MSDVTPVKYAMLVTGVNFMGQGGRRIEVRTAGWTDENERDWVR